MALDENTNKLYTRDYALLIMEQFEAVLSKYDICVPSDEDDEREEDDMIGLYGSTYSDLIDVVERIVIDAVKESRHCIPKQSDPRYYEPEPEIVTGEFSGSV